VEVICSNAAEHQRRVETRAMEVPGLLAPTWQAVLQHDYLRRNDERLVLDTASMDAEQAAARLLVEVQQQLQRNSVGS
jgi:hypothetical protein